MPSFILHNHASPISLGVFLLEVYTTENLLLLLPHLIRLLHLERLSLLGWIATEDAGLDIERVSGLRRCFFRTVPTQHVHTNCWYYKQNNIRSSQIVSRNQLWTRSQLFSKHQLNGNFSIVHPITYHVIVVFAHCNSWRASLLKFPKGAFSKV